MQYITSGEGLASVLHPTTPTPGHPASVHEAVLSEVAAAGGGPDTTTLWVGPHHRLARHEVRAVRDFLNGWLESGRLVEPAVIDLVPDPDAARRARPVYTVRDYQPGMQPPEQASPPPPPEPPQPPAQSAGDTPAPSPDQPT